MVGGILFMAPCAIFAQLTGDYANTPPEQVFFWEVGTSPGQSRRIGNWLATNVSLSSSYLINRPAGFQMVIVEDIVWNPGLEKLLVKATSP